MCHFQSCLQQAFKTFSLLGRSKFSPCQTEFFNNRFWPESSGLFHKHVHIKPFSLQMQTTCHISAFEDAVFQVSVSREGKKTTHRINKHEPFQCNVGRQYIHFPFESTGKPPAGRNCLIYFSNIRYLAAKTSAVINVFKCIHHFPT